MLFAGYRVPDPLVPSVELRVQTDGRQTPCEAVIASCEATVRRLRQLAREFTAAMALYQRSNAAHNPASPPTALPTPTAQQQTYLAETPATDEVYADIAVGDGNGGSFGASTPGGLFLSSDREN